jgi:DnaA N-terminal domain
VQPPRKHKRRGSFPRRHKIESPLLERKIHLGAFHNSPVNSSEKSEENPSPAVDFGVPPRNPVAFKLAAQMALRLGMTRTWANVQTIRLAIESEASFSSVTHAEAAAIMLKAAREMTRQPLYDCPTQWECREIARANTVDRFWFEDVRWRMKGSYIVFRSELTSSKFIAIFDDLMQPKKIDSPSINEPLPALPLDNPWTRILDALEKKINRHSYNTWLKPTRYSHASGGILFVRVPSVEFRYAGDKYANLIQEAIDNLGLGFDDVRFVMLEEKEPCFEKMSRERALEKACALTGISREYGEEILRLQLEASA